METLWILLGAIAALLLITYVGNVILRKGREKGQDVGAGSRAKAEAKIQGSQEAMYGRTLVIAANEADARRIVEAGVALKKRAVKELPDGTWDLGLQQIVKLAPSKAGTLVYVSEFPTTNGYVMGGHDWVKFVDRITTATPGAPITEGPVNLFAVTGTRQSSGGTTERVYTSTLV